MLIKMDVGNLSGLFQSFKYNLLSLSPLESACYAATAYLAWGFAGRNIWTPFKLYGLAQTYRRVKLTEYGGWAVVTGASQGIGFSFAKALAEQGLSLVLIDLSDERLERASEFIKSTYNVDVKAIGLDFTDTNTDVYGRIAREIAGLDIGVLINNVGMGLEPAPIHLVKDPMTSCKNLIAVNCLAMTEMTLLVLPRMVEKKRGVIVNMSSNVWKTAPMIAPYGASKAYVTILSQSLSKAYRKLVTGIIFHSLEPGIVDTPLSRKNLHLLKRFSLLGIYHRLFTISSDSFVRSALNTIGWTDRCHGHFRHFLQDADLIGGLILRLVRMTH